MKRLNELVGQRFNRWVVVGVGNPDSRGQARVGCVCDCGTTRSVLPRDLERGASKSCGCLRAESASTRFKTHGMSTTTEYRHYAGMLSRCSDTEDKNFADYGARGIKVCDEFVNDFLIFYQEIGPKPRDGQRWSVGRIDNNLGYVVGNVRWETDTQQARNHSLQKNNTTGVSGVTLRITSSDGDRYIARYNDLSGKRLSKSFSLRQYGQEVAFKMAVAWRLDRIKELNGIGAGYAASHGTTKNIHD